MYHASVACHTSKYTWDLVGTILHCGTYLEGPDSPFIELQPTADCFGNVLTSNAVPSTIAVWKQVEAVRTASSSHSIGLFGAARTAHCYLARHAIFQ